jgi:hypothetical protein
MHDEAGRLVDDDEVLVLVGDAEVHCLRLELSSATLRRLELELLAAGEPVALCQLAAVDPHLAARQEPFCDTA